MAKAGLADKIKNISGCDFVKNNTKFSVFLLIQAVLTIVLMVLAAVTPAHNIDIPVSDLKISNMTNATVSDNAIQFTPTFYKKDRVEMVSEEYMLPFGAYELQIDYLPQYLGTEAKDKVVANVAVYGDVLTNDSFFMKENELSQNISFWANKIGEKSSLSIDIVYKNKVELEINKISIVENTAYRFVCIFIVAFFIAVLDAVYAVLFSKNNIKWLNGKTVGVIAIILAASMPVFLPFIYAGHDILFHLNRIWNIADGLKSGIFPARMQMHMFNGNAYPVSIFYCDLFLYIPSLLCAWGMKLQNAYKVYVVMINAVTAVLSYKCFEKLSKSSKIALLGSALYTLDGYKLICTYTRAAVGEYTAMAFFPLVLLGMYKLYTKDEFTYRDWLPLALGMSAIISSHVLSTQIVSVFLVIFCIFNIRKTFTVKRLTALVKAVITTMALTVWYWGPFLEYYTTQEILVKSIKNHIQSTGIHITQYFNMLFNSVGASTSSSLNGEMSYSLGFGIAVAAIVLIYYFVNRKNWNIENSVEFKAAKALTLLSFTAACFAWYYFPWDVIQNVLGDTLGGFFGNIQFSWRYMSVVSITVVGAVVLSLPALMRYKPDIFKIVSVVIVAATMLSTSYYCMDLALNAGEMYRYSLWEGDSMYSGAGEYLLLGNGIEDMPNTDTYVKSGDARVENIYMQNSEKRVVVHNNSDSESVVEIPLLCYKYFKAYDIDTGEIIKISHGEKKRVALNVPANYSGTIAVKFAEPVHWRLAEIVSLISVIMLAAFVLRQKRKEKNKVTCV